MREMALAIGSHREIIGRIESGRHEVSLETVSRYARALGLDVATVLVCLDDEWRAADQTGRGE